MSRLIDEITIEESEDRYARLEIIDWWQQEKLKSATVLVVGAGALGNEIIKNLSLLGVGTLFIVDRDTVEATNLTRSILFRPENQGQPKAEVAAQRVREINDDITVVPIVGDLAYDIGLGIFKRADVIIGGLDSIGARLALNHACRRLNRSWIDAALLELNGIMRVYHHDHACFECGVTPEEFLRLTLSYTCQLLPRDVIEPIVATTPTSSSITSGMVVQEALRWLHDQHPVHSFGVEYNASDYSLSKRVLSLRPDCEAHDPIPSADYHTVAELSQQSTVADVLRAGAQLLGDPVERMVLELDRDLVVERACHHCDTLDTTPTPRHHLAESDNICPTCGQTFDLKLKNKVQLQDTAISEVTLLDLGIPLLHVLKVKSKVSKQSVYLELNGDLSATDLLNVFD